MRRWFLGFAVVLVVVTSACSSSSSSAPSVSTSSTVKTVEARPAGVNPSKSAQMVCAAEAQKDIRQALGVGVTTVTTPTWVDHVYSCDYVYPDGTFSMSVKELDSAQETTTSFDQLGSQLGRRPGDVGLGEGSFLTTNGSLVARKDWKVLVVDVAKLPAQFGQPPLSPSQVAESVGATIMGCWSGS
jgi:hypothetical protein